MLVDGLLEYSGLTAKTKAMRGRLLNRERYESLAEYETVGDFIAFLREAEAYAPIYASHEEIAHRGQVEAVLHDSLYADYQKLYRFAHGAQRQGLDIIFFRYEVNVLKTCLEGAMTGGGYSLGYLELIFDGHASFDVGRAAEAKSFEEFLLAVKDTDYEKLINRMSGHGRLPYGDYAFGLDVYYYETAWKQVKRIRDAKVRRILEILLGTEIDWQNIMWMYRFKRFYRMKPADIGARLIPVCWRLKKSELRRMAETESPEELKAIVERTSYFKGKEAAAALGDETAFRKMMEHSYESVCRKYPMSLAPVLQYLYDKEQEIDLLTSILEGIRYQLPAREIKELALSSQGRRRT